MYVLQETLERNSEITLLARFAFHPARALTLYEGMVLL